MPKFNGTDYKGTIINDYGCFSEFGGYDASQGEPLPIACPFNSFSPCKASLCAAFISLKEDDDYPDGANYCGMVHT
jgi:hypothetical protein